MLLDQLTEMALEERENQALFTHQVRVCTAAGCLSAQSDIVKDTIEKEVARTGIERWCQVKGVGCLGLCSQGPLVAVRSRVGNGADATVQETLYHDIQPADAIELIDALEEGRTHDEHICPPEMPFFTRQTKIVLENSGEIDPERIEDYISRDGYAALVQALTEMTPADVIEQVVRSGLRGRGGGGYPTGLKWTTVAKAYGEPKYVICNADEGDPGAFMDRSVLESDPHRVLEGMALAAYAIGASEGYIYVRGEYPLAVQRLKTAIRQAQRMGFLGRNICGTPFEFNLKIRLGAGAFVCGEETALIASIEGRRGTPRPRPPYPAEYGLWGKPTLINNVETFANVPPILRNGGDWYAALGTAKSKGTKVFALAGSIANTGLIEVPMGISLRELVYELGGGAPHGGTIKAVQTGGPSGGCIPAELFDTPVDYESLLALGSIMGSGGLVAMDESASMVDVARYFMEFCMTESCGKCVPCRTGTVQMHHLLDKLLSGEGTSADVALLEDLCDVVKNTSLCGLGQSAPNPVLSTLRYFRREYDALLQDRPQPLEATA